MVDASPDLEAVCPCLISSDGMVAHTRQQRTVERSRSVATTDCRKQLVWNRCEQGSLICVRLPPLQQTPHQPWCTASATRCASANRGTVRHGEPVATQQQVNAPLPSAIPFLVRAECSAVDRSPAFLRFFLPALLRFLLPICQPTDSKASKERELQNVR
jgi:hypothetical protein